MTSENWDPPPMFSMISNPPLWAAWRKRVDAWSAANPEMATAIREAELEDQDRRHAAEAARKALQEAKDARTRFEQTEAPERCIRAVLSGLKPTTATEAVSTYMASEKTFLLLSGTPGCGKTTASCEALRKGGAFFRAMTLSRMSMFDKDDREQTEWAGRAVVLVLDDIGSEPLHDGWRPALDELLDTRYGALRKTILTTNLPPTAPEGQQSFRARYGERITDRVRHDGFIVLCGSSSLRRQA